MPDRNQNDSTQESQLFGKSSPDDIFRVFKLRVFSTDIF